MFADSLHLKLQYTCVADAYMHVHVFAKTEYAFDPEHTPVPFRSDKASYPAAGKIYFPRWEMVGYRSTGFETRSGGAQH